MKPVAVVLATAAVQIDCLLLLQATAAPPMRIVRPMRMTAASQVLVVERLGTLKGYSGTPEQASAEYIFAMAYKSQHTILTT